MKYVRILCAVALVFALCSAFTMKDKEKAVYAFGVAASFNDSIVYYTDIQVLDSVELDLGFPPSDHVFSPRNSKVYFFIRLIAKTARRTKIPRKNI